MRAFLSDRGAILVGVLGLLAIVLYVGLYLWQWSRTRPQPEQAESPQEAMRGAKEHFAQVAQCVVTGQWRRTNEGNYMRLTPLASAGYLLEQLSSRTPWPLCPRQVVRMVVVPVYMDWRVAEIYLELAADAQAHLPSAIIGESHINPRAVFLRRVEIDARKLREWATVLASTV